MDRGSAGVRAVYRALGIARSIADFAGDYHVSVIQVSEAIQRRAYQGGSARRVECPLDSLV